MDSDTAILILLFVLIGVATFGPSFGCLAFFALIVAAVLWLVVHFFLAFCIIVFIVFLLLFIAVMADGR